jgi:hypothetical protein
MGYEQENHLHYKMTGRFLVPNNREPSLKIV